MRRRRRGGRRRDPTRREGGPPGPSRAPPAPGPLSGLRLRPAWWPGNRATADLLRGAAGVGPNLDGVEREADRFADAVVHGPAAGREPREPLRPTGRDGAESPRKLPETTGHPGRDPAFSPGRPLPEALRSLLEPGLGLDLSAVRLHTGPGAADAAARIGARAFTLGRDVAFAAGEYRPGTAAGRRLLAHELAHVVQQAGGSQAPRPAAAAPRLPRLGPDRSGLVRRTPGVDAEDSWDAVVGSVAWPRDSQKAARSREAVRRLLTTAAGEEQVNRLWRIFCRERDRCRSTVDVRFVDRVDPSHGDASGHFSPRHAGAARYTVTVANVTEDRRGLFGVWPGGRSRAQNWIVFGHSEAESAMASTLYHELRHVWFVNTHRRVPERLETGHAGTLEREDRDIHPDFIRGLRAMHADLEELEREAGRAARSREEEPAVRPEVGRPSMPDPAALREEGETGGEGAREPSPVGAVFEVRGGGGGGEAPLEGSGAGVVGADLLLGRIHALRLGARGLSLTPDRLLVGGVLGYRALEPRGGGPMGRSSDNPWFFDLEAGILAEVPGTEVERISQHLVGFGSAGFGQEFGREGPRFFWRVGGYVIIFDEGIPGGGGTAGVGLRL